jgi:hypothetical protein
MAIKMATPLRSERLSRLPQRHLDRFKVDQTDYLQFRNWIPATP